MKKTFLISSIIALIILASTTCFAAQKAYVACDVLNVRVSPNTDCEIVTKLNNNASVDIIYTTDNGWHNIQLENGVTGFVNAKYISTGQKDATSNGSGIAATVKNYIGCSYSYGSCGPYAFDCSGLTSYVYKQYGYKLPRRSVEQSRTGVFVDKNQLVAGDLVFFSNRGDRVVNHVGIYVGNGNFVHASTSGRGVVLDSLAENYYVRNYITARRVV